jgi:hypothetical protein
MDETAKPVTPALDKEVGQSGTFLTHGYLSLQDYNQPLTGIPAIRVWDTMRKSDATVRAAIMAVVLPILNATWSIEPADPENVQDMEVRGLIDHCLLSGETGVSWHDFLWEALKLELSYGRMFYEKVFTLVEFDGRTYIGWEKFGPRHPQTVVRYAIGQGEQERFGISQVLPTGPMAEIPGELLITLVNEKEGDNYEGISLLRTAHKPWDIKSQLERIDAIKHERQGLGVPFAQAKPGFSPSENERLLVQSALRNLRANENAFLEIPSGYEIGWMDMKAGTTSEMKDSIAYHDRQIMKNVLAQFLEIGGHKGSSGSFSASDTQMDLFMLSLQSVARHVATTIQQQAIKQLVDLNWPDYGIYPKLRVDKIGPENVTKFADAYLKGVEAHVITPTDEDEKFMRNIMEAPDFPEEMEGTVDRSFQPTAVPTEGDGAGTPPSKPPAKPAPTKKKMREDLEEVRTLHGQVQDLLYGTD